MGISACFTGCNVLQSYCKKCVYQYMENIAVHFLPVVISSRLWPGAAVLGVVELVVFVVVEVFAMLLLFVAVVGLEVVVVVELGS